MQIYLCSCGTVQCNFSVLHAQCGLWALLFRCMRFVGRQTIDKKAWFDIQEESETKLNVFDIYRNTLQHFTSARHGLSHHAAVGL